MPFGERLKALRTARGMSQMDVARVTGLSLSIVSQLEQGLTTNPRLNTVKVLCKALGCRIRDLVPDDDLDPEESPPRPGPKGRGKKGR